MLVFCAALLGFTWGCARQIVPDTREADERAVRESEIEMSKALAAKDLESLISFFADDASGLYPNTPAIHGKDALRQSWKTVLAIPGFLMSLQPVKVEVARSGDLAYVHGTWTRTMNDATGKPVADKGNYIVVYRKQLDGRWKIAADIGNSDLPLPSASAK
jgi:uncharacterized protein (TIGR02246 family)